jgi:CBS domain-containing protein
MQTIAIQPLHGSFLMPSLEHATVADAMHPGILRCEPDARLTDVARMMATHHVHCIAVMAARDDSGESLVWGLISDLDLIRAAGAAGSDDTARALARQPIISVKPTMPLGEAAEVMADHGVTHLVVVDPGTLRPIGVLSSLDVAGVLAWGEA